MDVQSLSAIKKAKAALEDKLEALGTSIGAKLDTVNTALGGKLDNMSSVVNNILGGYPLIPRA